jgi:hypothetical protein
MYDEKKITRKSRETFPLSFTLLFSYILSSSVPIVLQIEGTVARDFLPPSFCLSI